MYQYTPTDKTIVRERVIQFRGQVQRRLSGELTEDAFRPLRLMNGLYLQRHAYMLRVAIPYGMLSALQVRKLADIARTYDRGWAHFTTRQNIQYNWPKLKDIPDLLDELADVEMHAIQSSGNCIRNITADQWAGVAADELEDPRPYCELLRQWSTFHPEFSYLPRKFKIAMTGAKMDRAAIQVHDIGFRLIENEAGERGFEVIVGGGLGRTPIIGKRIRDFLPKEDLLSYTEAILRVYNLNGDRNNKYKARVKILVKRLGIEAFREQVEEEWLHLKDSVLRLPEKELQRIQAQFTPPIYRAEAIQEASALQASLQGSSSEERAFERWHRRNVHPHKQSGYAIVSISLKSPNRPPGDVTADQLDQIAALADTFSFGEVRTTHEQNLILGDVEQGDLFKLWIGLKAAELATPNIGTLTDLICCPGLDFCSLANAGSIGLARRITDRFDDYDELYDLGDLKLKMSGCINACGHHHVGHIGLLGVNKNDEEYYQFMLGGSAEGDVTLGRWLGPAISQEGVVEALDRLLKCYVETREGSETFLDTYRRLGREPFKEAVYP